MSADELIALARKCGARIVMNLPRSLAEPSVAVDVQISPAQLEAFAAALSRPKEASADLIALAEALYDEGYDSGCYECCHSNHDAAAEKKRALDDFAAALSARPKEAAPSEEQDAARYRWLRSMWCQTILEDLLDKMPGRNPQVELDDAIDAAGAALAASQAPQEAKP